MGSEEKDIGISSGVETSTEMSKIKHVDSTIEKHAHDADEAMKVFEGISGETIELDEATNRRLLKIIDWHMMPIMCLVYGMNYLDKTTLSYASVMGLKKDLNLKGDQYQWLGSLFYFGYLAWEYPTNRLLQRLPLGKYSAACILIWGLILSCFAAVSNYSGAIAIRFMLGVFEAAVTPGFALLTSQWYTKQEQGSRVNIWFSFNGVGQIFGGVVAYGIAVGAEKHGSSIDPWKIIFLVTGLLTICLGLVFLWIVPDSQLNARWLNEEDRILAVARVRVNQQGIGNKNFKWYQVKEALLDPMTWAFFFYALIADIPNGGITNFFNQLIASFGYTDQESLILGIPGGAVEIIALLLNGYVGQITGQRVLASLGGLVASIVGMLLIVALPLSNNVGRLIGYYLTQASPTPFVALLSLISSNVAGYTKKTTVAALYLIGYCAGNIIGPQTFRPQDAPRYVSAEVTIIVCWGVCLFLLVGVWMWYRRENKKKILFTARPEYVRLENQEWLDLTDRENPEFIYSL
ncbi:Major facilitator superfamily domain general substrate transporter [Penicillium cf. griseofulvum]|uniref:Major facilitator superfamily domain general substrate transporter n=1 Tax=Penicillium cf. griseofulvum TaxID=2972120 RepID=A0A9W9T3G6_9EURO|nr:Major facilitator superfamily domain general substrate transporter [Penicillium cf. griseofulvum]KAJ5446012.1 Major facilitator superfamily domain general substrate transporter [Penicillium cf. griseofulvum]KAJ5447754.1 Major facilitator superfamily domain general substrate transporter [Penicillium cf. griseofulvum]